MLEVLLVVIKRAAGVRLVGTKLYVGAGLGNDGIAKSDCAPACYREIRQRTDTHSQSRKEIDVPGFLLPSSIRSALADGARRASVTFADAL